MSQDGFGTRTLSIDTETGDPVEVLTLAPVLGRAPEVGMAVGERVARLARVRHAMYARVRKLERPSDSIVRLLSDHVPGWRLDRVLDVNEREGWTLDISAVITLLRQLIPAVALFSRHQRDATIGTIGPERLILTPQGRLVVAEYVLAPGLEKLQFPRERLWREFRVAVPYEAAAVRIPPSADVVAIGVVAISLLLGRRLKDDEYLVSLGDLFETLTETSAGSTKKLSPAFCTWVARALQFEPEVAFQSTQEAQVAFEEMLARERSYVTTTAQLDRFITNFERVAGAPRTPASAREEPIYAAVAEGAEHDASGPTIAARTSASLETEQSLTAALAAMSQGPTSRAFAREHAAVTSYVDTVGIIEPSAPVAGSTAAAPVTPAATEAPDVPDAISARNALSEPSAPGEPSLWRRVALPGLAVVVLVQAGVIAWLATSGSAASLIGGELTIQSRPASARVTIDGEDRGLTPFQTEISPGSHVVEVRVGRSEPRVIPVVIRSGVQTGLYVELQSVATVGGLEVRTEPAKARVTVGGQYRGETPLVLKDLPPGDVDVVIQGQNREVRQTVRIEPGITSQLVVPLGR